MKDAKSRFGSKFGAILAAAGSAVGLGNVWRFPTEAGEHGGAAFILIYVAFMLLLGVPVMITELAIGRHGGDNVSHSFVKMSGGRKAWGFMGWMPVIAGVMVLSYYSVVAGWTLEYLFQSLFNRFEGKTAEMFIGGFNEFASSPAAPVVCLFAIIALTCAIVAGGVKGGIERAARIMMPVLFICIGVLVVCSFSLPGFGSGISFLFNPDFSKVDGTTVLSAMGQSFFSLSVGICCLCTYGCYFRKDVNLMSDSLSVASIDTLVAVMSGLIIFPAVFSVSGLAPDAGPSLVFITLPNVFLQVFAGAPALAYAFSVLFYFLLVLAALTSSVSMLEMSAAIFVNKFGVRRPVACIAISLVCFLLGSLCSLSFGCLSGVTLFGLTFFDLFDFIVAKFLMPIGAFVMCIFVGWVVDDEVLRGELTNGGLIKQPLYGVCRFIVRFVAPICIALIFLNELNLF